MKILLNVLAIYDYVNVVNSCCDEKTKGKTDCLPRRVPRSKTRGPLLDCIHNWFLNVPYLIR